MTFKISTIALLSTLCAMAAADRTFIVINNCQQTIWPVTWTDLNVGSAVPFGAPDLAGWEAKPGSSKTFFVPDNWRSGRIWARTGCDFTNNNGPLSCLTGGCNGGLACDPRTGTGVPPASLAEWTLDGVLDWYDVSLVDGFNLPVKVETSTDCDIADCSVDLNIDCPSELRLTNGTNGAVAGCKSDCLIDPNPQDSPSCCSGSHSLPGTCPPSGVKNYNFFKSKCPNSYVYAYDESSGSALWTCPAEKKANYTITFCPQPA